MSGLVAYGSSDEEDVTEQASHTSRTEKATEVITDSLKDANGKPTEAEINGHATSAKLQQIGPEVPMVGPALGPSDNMEAHVPFPFAEGEVSAPQSPYSTNRARLHELTLPPIPNMDIPDSPPGSPPASTNARFTQFLELKKQGVHFNEKLAKSSALKNPMMMDKLLAFADLVEVDEYSSTLAIDLWNPEAFPVWAYKEKLANLQKQISKKREDEKSKATRELLDFVPATASGDSSRSGTPGLSAGGRAGPKSAAERIMAGLDRGRSTSPAVQAGMKRKTRFES